MAPFGWSASRESFAGVGGELVVPHRLRDDHGYCAERTIARDIAVLNPLALTAV